MSEHTVRRCDECLAMHGEANNWWCVIGDTERPTFVTFATVEELQKDGRLAPNAVRLDYCSHQCVGTAFHRWLDTGDVRKAAAGSEEP
jgi:hypothetical protein